MSIGLAAAAGQTVDQMLDSWDLNCSHDYIDLPY